MTPVPGGRVYWQARYDVMAEAAVTLENWDHGSSSAASTCGAAEALSAIGWELRRTGLDALKRKTRACRRSRNSPAGKATRDPRTELHVHTCFSPKSVRSQLNPALSRRQIGRPSARIGTNAPHLRMTVQGREDVQTTTELPVPSQCGAFSFGGKVAFVDGPMIDWVACL